MFFVCDVGYAPVDSIFADLAPGDGLDLPNSPTDGHTLFIVTS